MYKNEGLEKSALAPILLEAINNDRKDEVANILKADVSLLNAELNKGYTTIAHAIRLNKINIVEFLLTFNELSLSTGDSHNPDAEDFARFWGREEIVQLIKNFKMKKKDKNLGLNLNDQRIISSPHQSVELDDKPNPQYASKMHLYQKRTRPPLSLILSGVRWL